MQQLRGFQIGNPLQHAGGDTRAWPVLTDRKTCQRLPDGFGGEAGICALTPNGVSQFRYRKIAETDLRAAAEREGRQMP